MKGSTANTAKYLQPEVKIHGNTLSFNGIAIQISNISRIWLGEIPKSLWWLIFGVLWIPIGIGFLLIIYFFKKNKRTFNIQLNSGTILVLTSRQDSFYEQAFCAISECFTNRSSDTMVTINFGNGTVIHGSVVNNGNNYIGNNIHIEYSQLENDLSTIKTILMDKHCNNQDILYIDEILKDIKNRNNRSILDKLKNIPMSILETLRDLGVQVGGMYIAKFLGIN